MFRNIEESRPIISLGRRTDPYNLYSDSEDDFEEIEFDKAVFERQFKYDYDPSRTRRKAKRKMLFCLLFVALFLGILVALSYYYFSKQVIKMQQKIENDELNVKIDGGFVRGVLEDKTLVFKGIPYAKPPQRWKAPSHCGVNECWNGTFQAVEFGEQCVQARFKTNKTNVEAIGSEDCLFINVWTPITADAEMKLPVMVYLHGGGLVSSSGNENGLHPDPEMVREMKVVGVSLNYRLDAFGFLALDILNNSENTSGNYGFMDQIFALQWVRENIAQFGGDPGKVTLLGQGSGGTSVLALLSSPLAKGLFHRAIALSASADIVKTSSEAAKDNEVFLRNAKCSGNKLDCLNALSPLEILKASPWNGYQYWQKDNSRDFPTKGIFDYAIAVIDGFVIPTSPVVSIKSKKFNDVPLILGNTAQETDDRLHNIFQNSSLVHFKAYAKTKLLPFLQNNSSKLNSIFSLYKMETSNKSADYFHTTIVSDIREVCPVEYLAVTATKHFVHPVYRYVVTNTPSHYIYLKSGPSEPHYSFHMWDLIAFYNFPKAFQYNPSKRDYDFKNSLRNEFIYFIHNGKVKSNTWLKHPKTTAIFSNKGLEVIQKIYHRSECIIWLMNGFAPYSWIN